MAVDPKFWDCRDFGHAWKVDAVAVVAHSPIVYERTFSCARGCGTKRREQFEAGALARRNYRYGDGYKIERDRRDREVAAIRAKNLRRYTKKPKRRGLRVVA